MKKSARTELEIAGRVLPNHVRKLSAERLAANRRAAHEGLELMQMIRPGVTLADLERVDAQLRA